MNHYKPEPWESNPAIQTFLFDEGEAQGKVGIERGAYGIWIYVPGVKDPVALVDLFYLSPGGKDIPHRPACPQIVIHDTVGEDPVAFARFTPERTEVSFETGVKQLRCRATLGRTAWSEMVFGQGER